MASYDICFIIPKVFVFKPCSWEGGYQKWIHLGCFWKSYQSYNCIISSELYSRPFSSRVLAGNFGNLGNSCNESSSSFSLWEEMAFAFSEMTAKI